MCGRFTLTVDGEVLTHLLQIKIKDLKYTPRYNIAPGQEILTVVAQRYGREGVMMRWGLIPRWAKEDMTIRMINARAETITEKQAFRDSFHHRRCLIPADSFFEWKKLMGHKIPYRIVLPDTPIFTFAGIWDEWVSPQGQTIRSCTLLTTTANNFMRHLHDRMPVILAEEASQQAWLGLTPADNLKELLHPSEAIMLAHQVSTLVNSPNIDTPEVIRKED